MLEFVENWFQWHCHMDSSGHYSFDTWKKSHPNGTLKDWWDLQAHKKSGGALPNPLDNPEVAERLKRR